MLSTATEMPRQEEKESFLLNFFMLMGSYNLNIVEA